MSDSSRRRFLSTVGRWGLFVSGLVVISLLVRSVGLDALFDVLVQAAPVLPVVLALDLAWALFETAAHYRLLGPARQALDKQLWLQGALAHYATMMILPVGRAGAETVRATVLGKQTGLVSSSTAAALIQSSTLLNNSLMSFAAFVVVVRLPEQTLLSSLLLGNAVVTLLLGALFYVSLRGAGFLRRFRGRFDRLGKWGPEVQAQFERTRSRHGGAFSLSFVGRSFQTLQYGVIVWAVGGIFTPATTLVAQGVHLVSTGLGDFVPNQVGVTEGAYRWFASALGLEAVPEKAVAIALVARFSNVTLAACAGLGLLLIGKTGNGGDRGGPRKRIDPGVNHGGGGLCPERPVLDAPDA